jgi:hypothetical protein
MDVASLHSPLVRRTIQTINEGRLDEFLALFAPDATIVDGATYHGSEAIRAWAERETFGVQMHIDVVQEKKTEGTSIIPPTSSLVECLPSTTVQAVHPSFVIHCPSL